MLVNPGCVDARVPENLMMGEVAGNFFCHSNVSNYVVNTDINLLSALQYGVSYLHSEILCMQPQMRFPITAGSSLSME